jgi:hypothetical protein
MYMVPFGPNYMAHKLSSFYLLTYLNYRFLVMLDFVLLQPDTDA